MGLNHNNNIEKPLHITALAFPGFPMTSLTGPLEMLSAACQLAKLSPPEITIVTVDDSDVQGIGGLTLHPTSKITDVKDTDILLISAIGDPNEHIDKCTSATFEWINSLSKQAQFTVSICTGAFLLARAGVLNYRTATTHWMYADLFRDNYPKATLVTDQRFTQDNNVLCTSGIHSHDKAILAVIEGLWGSEHKTLCEQYFYGKELVPEHGGDNTFRPYKQHSDALIFKLQDWMHNQDVTQLSVSECSKQCHLSERQMKRRFKAATNETPMAYIQRIKINHAKDKLHTTNLTIEQISNLVGYDDTRHFRQLFKKFYDMTPSDYRKSAIKPSSQVYSHASIH
ncbi:GlxA family transcriptional regulator [Photobacterium sp. J15]|uniref:GlxA family transcriptional regulator n=1 Tax=Photobacterium sp. J15 TaxID=265901 RepID=UPI000AFCB161|nr:helix-turn-helix domain-containing protein [Photobacterium sp. J15]